jgi:hypothetical protein
MRFWCWLSSNSAALQSIAALGSVALAAITILVLIATWRAIKRQAAAAEEQTEAARALTRVATEQTKAAIDAAESARKQSDLLSSQIEQATATIDQRAAKARTPGWARDSLNQPRATATKTCDQYQPAVRPF